MPVLEKNTRLDLAQPSADCSPTEAHNRSAFAAILVMAMTSPDRMPATRRSPIGIVSFAEKLDQRYGGMPKTLR